MPETITNTEAVLPAQASQVSQGQLEQAFALFNRVSDELGSTWRELETRVADLSDELAVMRSARLRELAEKEKLADKLSTLMAALPGAVVLVDSANRVEEYNPAAEHMLGPGLLGRRWDELVESRYPGHGAGDNEIQTPAGRRLALVSNELANGGARIVLMTDITESLELSRLLHREQRLRELGDMAARLAHQLRTPLSTAMLYLSQLDRAAEQPDQARQAGGKIRERLGHIERLIEGMLAYIQGSVSPRAAVSLNALLTEVHSALEPRVSGAGGVLQLDLSQREISLWGQEAALFEALSNLVENALQSCGDRIPRISIGLYESGQEAMLVVEDNGPGVDEDLRERIFDPWFSTRAHGTGLGLAVVLGALQSHGGEARVGESATGGARFELRIPLAPGPVKGEG